jgi:hypothetical protein|tara:strand:- start:1572 stop:1784 length:213 start_codon:yes stop_codon:yes gene_type:complete
VAREVEQDVDAKPVLNLRANPEPALLAVRRRAAMRETHERGANQVAAALQIINEIPHPFVRLGGEELVGD